MKCSPVTRNFCKRPSVRSNAAGNLHGPVISKSILSHCTPLIEAEAQRIAADMKRLAAPNSPDKNHFMVEVSPYFTKLASSRDTDQLLAMLPYKSLHLSSVKDRFGIYALINKNENRDRGIRKPRASVRKQLSETKQAASPKKAAARSKQHEMEV